MRYDFPSKSFLVYDFKSACDLIKQIYFERTTSKFQVPVKVCADNHFEVERSVPVKSDAIEKKWYEYESSNETPRNG